MFHTAPHNLVLTTDKSRRIFSDAAGTKRIKAVILVFRRWRASLPAQMGWRTGCGVRYCEKPLVNTPPPLDARAALFIDVDGTLLEIAPRPELVRVPPELPGMLDRLAAKRDGALALVSGRPLSQIDSLFRPWCGAASGLHGSERRRADCTMDGSGMADADRAAGAALDRLRPTLAELAARDSRLLLEDKGATVALHYRAAPERAAELRRQVEALLGEAGAPLRLIAGKQVLEFQPRHRNKGVAIAAFLEEAPFRDRMPVFLGDDVTDEDGFAEVNRRDGISIRVGAPAHTAARHALPSVTAVLAWLARGD